MKTTIRLLSLALILSGIVGCAGPQTQRVAVSDSATKAEALKQQEIAVQDMVAEQSRITRVYRALATKAQELCGDAVILNTGALFMVRPKGEMGDAMNRLYGLQAQPSVLFVVEGSPAASAGLRVKDVLKRVNAKEVADINALQELFETLPPEAPINFEIERAGALQTVTINPERACKYPATLSPEQIINAFADGKRIMIARGMMNFVKDDNELALVLSHELAHNTMKHIEAKKQNMGLGLLADLALIIMTRGQAGNPNFAQAGAGAFSQEFESEADYVGLYIMAKAGLPIADAPKFWRRMAAAHPANIKTNHSASHPSTAYRMVALEETVKEINEKILSKQPLSPNMKDGKPAAPTK